MPQYLFIENIAFLYGITTPGILKKSGSAMNEFTCLRHAWILSSDGIIEAFGNMNDEAHEELKRSLLHAENLQIQTIDASGKILLPSFIDSHTHLVFAATREDEFVMRLRGKSYEEIAAAGGGILNSAAKLQQMTEDELFEGAVKRLKEVIGHGTGAIEIKSGYGLTVEDEIKMLRVINRLKQVSPITIKSTFLGAHAIPASYKGNREGYIRLIIEEMLPKVVDEKLADYCDVFCDQGFFTPEETDIILKAAAAFGLKAKIHGNELGYTGGVQVAVKNGALSVDHLEYTGEEEMKCLINSQTMPVGLPNCSFFLGIPYAPGRKMIDSGLPFCLASDYNPGSSPNGRMGFVISLACTQMKLTPEEAFNAATINGAYALELSSTHGSIALGKVANFIITKPIPSLAFIPYNFGSDCFETIILNGKIWPKA